MVARAVWAAVAVAVGACLLPYGGAHLLRNAAVSAQGNFVFDYAHNGEDWIHGSCSSRQRQSPINFDDLFGPVTGTLSYMYQPVSTSVEVANNGHNFAVDFAGLGYGGITYNGAWYNLMNINVHSKSEHTFMGLHRPVELHLVHKRFDGDGLLIVAIPVTSAAPPAAFAQESVLTNATKRVSLSAKKVKAVYTPGSWTNTPVTEANYVPPSNTEANFNLAVQMFLAAAPPQINQKSVSPFSKSAPLDLSLFFQGGTFFEYAGSLTAPPCAEIATWFVRREPLMASDVQVKYLHDGILRTTEMYGNARATMPLNGRVIGVRQAVPEKPPPHQPDLGPPKNIPCLTRECRAMNWAKDAIEIAKASTDYIRDLDVRLRKAAQGHVNALDGKKSNDITPVMPIPPPMQVQGPTAKDMHKTAKAMGKVIASAAKEAIGQAAQQVAANNKLR